MPGLNYIYQICLKPLDLNFRQKFKSSGFKNAKTMTNKRKKNSNQGKKILNYNNFAVIYCGLMNNNINEIIKGLKSLPIVSNILEISINKSKNIIYITFFNVKTNKIFLNCKNIYSLKLFKLQVSFYKQNITKLIDINKNNFL